jgi:hypothetical protein
MRIFVESLICLFILVAADVCVHFHRHHLNVSAGQRTGGTVDEKLILFHCYKVFEMAFEAARFI